MKAYGLLPWQQQALLDAYLAGEKVEAIAQEFGVNISYPRLLAKRRGHPVRPIGRPPNKAEIGKTTVAQWRRAFKKLKTKRVHPAKRAVACDSRPSPVIG